MLLLIDQSYHIDNAVSICVVQNTRWQKETLLQYQHAHLHLHSFIDAGMVVNFSPESGWSAHPLHPFVCPTVWRRVSLLIDGMMRLGKDGHCCGRNTEKQLGPNTEAAHKTTHERETSAETDTHIST